jgi:tRNA1(Val) A37 N6-methylase TrmN6
LPYKRFTDIKEQLSLHQLRVTQILFVRHSASHPFSRLFIEGQLGIPGNDVWSSSEIAIKEEAEKYSSEFTALLKDYYLNF